MSVAERVRPAPAPRTAGVLRASLRLLGSEMRIISGRRRNQAGLLVLASVPVLIAVAVKMSAPRRGRGPDFLSSITSNGIFVALTALTIEVGLFLPLAVAALAGDTVAGEANTGTLRYLLTVPVHRTRLLLVKYASLVLGACIGVVVVALTGVLIGAALFGLGPMTLLSGSQIGLADAFGRLGIVVLYLSCGLAALAAVGLFISTLTEQPIGAMIAVTIVSTAMWILDGIAQLEWLHPWLLVHDWLSFSDVFRDPVFWDAMRQGLLVDLGYVVVFLALAWARFAQKDITS
ncbi:MAG TPA: ABC transporter permease [Candidatus Lustribacter sp.]|nr:ABC transporter permease [Candidatus Lustribacter sp.]